MTKVRLIVALFAVLACFVVSPPVSNAYDGFPSFLGYGWNSYRGGLYSLGRVPVPPYYALHPPVYYGERYFRSYGGSPYARSGNSALQRPERAPVRPTAVIVNPHVEQKAEQGVPPVLEPKGGEDQVTVHPVMIVNPYYEASESKVARK